MPALPAPLLLYDGSCALCATTVRFILARERAPVLLFAPLEGRTAAGLLDRHPWLRAVDSLVLVEGERVRVRSDAALAIAAGLRWPWPLLRAARLVPPFLRDRLYDLVARHRHRLVRPAAGVAVDDTSGRFLP